jgi:hypothetical protein
VRRHTAPLWQPAIAVLVALAIGGVAPTAVAAPAKPRPRCAPRDELVPIKHGDGGGVWIPREVACGGAAHVVVMLHGFNSDRVKHVSIGGGRLLEDHARALLDARRVRPVVLAEPIHFRVCGNGLYDDAFDFPAYRQKLEAVLKARRIRVLSYSVTGHSGAGCCGGVYRAAQAFAPLKLLGLIDTCYGGDHYFRAPHDNLDGRGTIVVNVSRGEPGYPGYRRFEEQLLGPDPLGVGCNTEVYRRCLRSARRPYYSFSTVRIDGPYHGEIPTDVFRTLMLRVFGRKSRAPATQGTE